MSDTIKWRGYVFAPEYVERMRRVAAGEELPLSGATCFERWLYDKLTGRRAAEYRDVPPALRELAILVAESPAGRRGWRLLIEDASTTAPLLIDDGPDGFLLQEEL